MLELEKLKKIDKMQMHSVYDRWPDIAIEHYRKDLDSIEIGDISHIVFAGMGGSGTIGDIFASILSKTNIHVNVVKGYLLPKTVNSETLVVATSVSGNTKETISTLKSANDLNCKIIAFSDGGKMKEFCNKNSIEHRQIDMMHSPRASFTAYLYSMLKVLKNGLVIKDKDIIESINKMESLKMMVSSANLSEKNPALSLAEWIKEIPLIYYPLGLQAVATRFKNSLQENAKQHAMIEDVIESCHNGIVAWEKNSVVQPILIQGKDDYFKTKERWDILKEFFQTKDIEYKEIRSVTGNILTKIIHLIYHLDYTSIYKAVLMGIDPSPVKSIDFVKSRL